MDILDEFDISIIKELEKDGRIAYSTIASNLKISNTMVHQRINRMIEQGVIGGIKPIIQEKKIGYDWASFTGITLNKDSDSDRIIEALKEIPEATYLHNFHALAEKNWETIAAPKGQKKNKKFVDFLLRKGYETSLIFEKLKQMDR